MLALREATLLFPVGSLVFKLSLIHSTCFRSLPYTVSFYSIESPELGLRGLVTKKCISLV